MKLYFYLYSAMKAKIITISSLIILLVLGGLFYFKFFFVFGDGVKAGELNQFTYKGYVFKTYEGRVIQSGFKTGGAIVAGESNLGSYIFDFSVENQAVADSLMKCSGKVVELHYKEYNGTLPWRGMQKHVVDKIISVKEPSAY